MPMTKTYSDVLSIPAFIDRYSFLRLGNLIGDKTFGHARYLNQILYSSVQWRQVRDQIILRDHGLDLASIGHEILGVICVHHINPLCPEDIEYGRSVCFDPENLICVSERTHRAIHYGDSELLPALPVTRFAGDTKLW